MYEITLPGGVGLLAPSVGEECPLDQMVEICEMFGRHTAAAWLVDDPPLKPFVFNGCSGPAPDTFGSGIDLLIPCLLHDITYFGANPADPDAEKYRALTDYQFAIDLLNWSAPPPMVDLYLTGVRGAGAWWPGAKWGYGRRPGA